MFCPRGAFVARQFRFRNDCASRSGAFPARLKRKRQFVVNWTSCARLVSSRGLTENLRPGLLPAEVPQLRSRGANTPVFRNKNVAQLAQLTTNLGFASPKMCLIINSEKCGYSCLLISEKCANALLSARRLPREGAWWRTRVPLRDARRQKSFYQVARLYWQELPLLSRHRARS